MTLISTLLGVIAPIGATGPTGATGVGLVNANGDILPVVAGVSNIGSANNKFNSLYTKTLFLDANTLYVDGVPVLSSSANNISFSADPNQGLRFTTTGTGNVVLTSNAGTTIQTTGQNGDVLVQSSGQGGLTRVTSATQVTLTAPTIAVVGNQTVSSNLTVSGNFTVAGNVTSVDSTITNIKDNIITLNKGEVGSGVTLNVSGIEVDRGDLARQRLIWNEAAGKWTAGPTSSEVALATETFVNTGLSGKANTDLSNVGTLPDAVINQLRGYTGATGVSGASGAAGTNGASGFVGSNGATGAAGTQGASGVQGASGAAGTNGASGFVGSNGATGPTGASGATGTVQNWSVKTTTYTAVNKDSIAANTVGGAFTITLPSSPSAGHSITIADSGHSFNTNNLTVARNGSTIELAAEDLVIDVKNIFISLIYDGITWKVFSTAGIIGASGATGTQGASGVGATGAGVQGASGVTGASGATGSAGTNGATGSAGTNGATGSAGTNGATGSAGTNGATGSAGTNGATGTQGASGAAGTNGATGPTGATGVGASGATGTVQNWSIKTTTYTAVTKDSIAANTAGGAFTITLPATPSTGDFINIADSGHTFGTNNLTIGRNGSTIEAEAANFIIDVSNVFVSFIYDGTTWRVFSNLGVQGVQGASGPASINQFLLMGA